MRSALAKLCSGREGKITRGQELNTQWPDFRRNPRRLLR